MNHSNQKLKVTAVEHASGVITAFVNQFPGLVVQASSKEEVERKLDALMEVFIRKLQAGRKNLEIETRFV